MTRYISSLFLLLFIVTTLPVSSQNCFDAFLKKHQNSSFIHPYKVDSLLKNCNTTLDTKINIADHFSIYYRRKKKLELAIKYAQIEIDYYKKSNRIKGIGYENVIYNKGKFHYYNSEYKKAISLFKEVIQLNISPLKSHVSLIQIGKCYRNMGEFFKAEGYFTKAIKLLTLTSSSKHLFNAYIYKININKQIDTKQSIHANLPLLKELKKLLNKNKQLQTPARYFRHFFNKGNVFSALLKLDYKTDSLKNQYFRKSKSFFKKALRYAQKINDSNRISLVNISLGSIHITQEKDSALHYLKESLKFNNKNRYNKALSYNNISYYYLTQKQPELALKFIQNAINISFSVNENKKDFIPSNLQLYSNEYKKHSVLQLTNKAEILISLFTSTQHKFYLKKAIETIKISDKLIDFTIKNSYDLKTKFLWRKEASDAYLFGTKASHLLSDYNTMFYFMEKNRAILLTENIQQNTNQTNLSKNLANKIYFFNKKIFELDDAIKDSSNTYLKLKDSLFNFKKKYDIFNDSLKQYYPSIFNNHAKIESLNKLKPKLKLNSVIVSYMVNKVNFKKETMLGLIISRNNNKSFEVTDLDKFRNTLHKYKTLIYNPLKTKSDLDKFKNTSYNLYDQLFPTNYIKSLVRDKNITIIPDISFENIPFEALNTNKKDINYLIEDNNISYAYSYSFLKTNQKRGRKPTNKITSFAPIEFKNNKISSLPHTKKEIENISSLINGEAYTYNNSNKENFLNAASKSKIIHLATHAKYSKTPTIYFSKDSLKLYELYTYKNNADLVVLSACETNLGEIKQGEGTLSLARGFFHAGANSVVSSLWNVNDAATSYLMNDFYSNLKNNQSKTEALNNAKRKYLKEHSLSEKSPYYWASFILIGDTNPTFKDDYINYFIILIVFGFLFILFFIKKRG